MRESVVYSTKNNNLYLYDARYMFSLLIHPDMEKVHNKSPDADSYYLKKYEYLTNHGFWRKSEPVEFETAALDEATVKENIIQTNQIIFEVTDRCNLNCPYCSLGEMYEAGKKERKNMNIRYAINFLKYIYDLKVKNKIKRLAIAFFGGEPLVNIRFIKQIVEVAYQLNAGNDLKLVFTMTTNATLLHKHIQFLVANDFHLLISLDGNEESQSYRSFVKNNQNSFKQVIANIDMIQRDYPAYFADRVKFNAVLHNRNSVKSIYEFVYKRYHKIPRIAQLNTDNVNPCKKELFERMFVDKWKSEEDYQNEASDLLLESRKKFISYKEFDLFLRYFSINIYRFNLSYLLFDCLKLVPTGTCSPFERKIFLNTHHNVLPCDTIIHKYAMGKVNENVIIDIPEIVRKFNLYYERFKDVCQNCYASPRPCTACLLTTGNLDKLDTEELVCNEFQNKEAFKNKLNHIFTFLEKNRMIYFN